LAQDSHCGNRSCLEQGRKNALCGTKYHIQRPNSVSYHDNRCAWLLLAGRCVTQGNVLSSSESQLERPASGESCRLSYLHVHMLDTHGPSTSGAEVDKKLVVFLCRRARVDLAINSWWRRLSLPCLACLAKRVCILTLEYAASGQCRKQHSQEVCKQPG
jgi:hypothetical protein